MGPNLRIIGAGIAAATLSTALVATRVNDSNRLALSDAQVSSNTTFHGIIAGTVMLAGAAMGALLLGTGYRVAGGAVLGAAGGMAAGVALGSKLAHSRITDGSAFAGKAASADGGLTHRSTVQTDNAGWGGGMDASMHRATVTELTANKVLSTLAEGDWSSDYGYVTFPRAVDDAIVHKDTDGLWRAWHLDDVKPSDVVGKHASDRIGEAWVISDKRVLHAEANGTFVDAGTLGDYIQPER